MAEREASLKRQLYRTNTVDMFPTVTVYSDTIGALKYAIVVRDFDAGRDIVAVVGLGRDIATLTVKDQDTIFSTVPLHLHRMYTSPIPHGATIWVDIGNEGADVSNSSSVTHMPVGSTLEDLYKHCLEFVSSL